MNAKLQTSNFRAWIVCLSAALFFAYELVQLHMLNAISPMLMKDLNINATSFGYLCSTYLLADVLFLLPAGIILDKVSVRKVILGALFICIAATVGFAFSKNFQIAALCHFLSGIGNAFCFLSCMMFVSRWFPPKKQAFVIGVVVTIGMLGGVIAQSPFSYLASKMGWREAMLVDAAIGGFVFLVVLLFAKDAPNQFSIEKSSTSFGNFFKDTKEALVSKVNLSCGVYTGLMNLPVMVIGAVYGSLFLSQIHKMTLTSASFVVSMICMGTIIGSSLSGYLADKLQKRTELMTLGALLSFGVMLLIMFMPYISYIFMAALFFALGLFSSTQVLGYSIITESSPKHLTGTSMGIAAVIIMGLAALAQPLTGKLIDLNWDKTMVSGAPLYSFSNYLLGFAIFPIGFFVSLLTAFKLKKKSEPLKAS